MKKTPWIISAAAAGVLAVGGGGTAWAVSNEADVSVYGATSTVRTFSPTVGDLLDAQGVKVRATDLVTPALDTPVTDGIDISVVQQNLVTVLVDGVEQTVLTPGGTVADALEQVDYRADQAIITPDPSTELSSEGTTVEVSTLKTVTFIGQYGQATFDVHSRTVGEAMTSVLQDIQDGDVADPGRDTVLTDGMTITVHRLRENERKEVEELPFTTTTEKTDTLTVGSTEVKSEGKVGTKEKVVKDTVVDGQVTGTEVVSETVTAEPVGRVILEGTKPKPAATVAAAPSTAASSGSSGSSGSGSSSSSSSSGGSAAATDQGGTASGAVETCQASNYGSGDGTDGGPTASGETFNASAMTAAHKTLPLGTRIKVTNTANGKSVIVRINDRGPYAGGRCLDLSSGAFSQIASLSQGVATVSWQRVG
ncbi:septal ring lytic transglycosylase RlpA family protein [Brachybacterium equifaecis]|uniref:septal ring lytic transglycosylase RlpA family protein n=1 Tax=Brachybacterium equifaecis TaxID=2910770 RepID=UPI0024BD962D|nr:septal ring lytic transglycosylase RlpA family protein [Brachybacterium equifaecis]